MSSLFGNSTQTTTASSIFGAPASSAPTGASSLFGGTAATSAPTNTSGLFGNTTGAQAPATGASLFGGGAGAGGATSTGGLFGAGPSTQAPANTSSLFGGGITTSQAPIDNGSLFKDGLLSSKAPDLGPTDPNTPTAEPAYFDALLQRGKKRQTDGGTNAFGELPQLQLGLHDISRKVRNLGQGGPSAGLARATDARAHYLLSASGVNAEQALRDLDDLTGPAVNRGQATADDVHYASLAGVKETLAQKYQNDFQKMVDSHVQRAQEDFNRMIDEKLHGVDWNAHRQRIHEHFGLKKPSADNSSVGYGHALDRGSFGRSSRRSNLGMTGVDGSYGMASMTKSIIGTPGPRGMRTSMFGDVAEKISADGMRPAPEDRVLRGKQEKYANKVRDLNLARLREAPYPILHEFAAIEAEPSNDDTSMLCHAFNALADVVDEDADPEAATVPGPNPERKFAKDYLDENPNSTRSILIRKRIINGSRHFLEQLFYSQVKASIVKNAREANVGGVPTPVAKIKGYVRVRAVRKELGPDIELLQEVNGDYCWPVLFYLLRCGLLNEALEYVDENASAFRQIDRAFTRYLRAYVNSEDHRLSPEMQTQINNEYSQRSRLAPEDSIDPYRMVCYKIIGRCEVQKRSLDGITNDIMDWIWLQFALAREYNRVDDFAHEAFGLDELRASIKEIGERYFGPGSDVANAPTTFFFMQILAGMFEKAIADLYPHNYMSAVHYAIALAYYGLLRVSDISNSEDLLTVTTRSQAQIAFGSMIGLYTRDFRTANPSAAVEYLCLICLNGDLDGELGKKQREICYQALTETVLETRDFAQLLGDIRADGVRIKGEIERRLKLIDLENEHEFLKHITLVAARTAEDNSRATDAALLFHLAEDYDKVISVVNEAVSQALTTEIGQEPGRLTPLKPRTGTDRVEPQEQSKSSLSLTMVDDPVMLARNMAGLYGSNNMYYSKVKETTRTCCEILLRLASARQALEANNWPKVIDDVTSAAILPTEVQGNITAIRQKSQAFNLLPAVVARTVGYVMLWTVVACAKNIEKLRTAEFETGAQQDTIFRCQQTSRDIMVFAGLIRFKLPARVWDMLARVGGDVGAY